MPAPDDADIPRPAGDTGAAGDTGVAGGTGVAGEAGAVTVFWQDLGLPGLVDVHTHFMPPNVLTKVWAFFEDGRAAVGQAWPIVYRQPEEGRLALLLGSDFPNIPYPYLHQLQALADLGLGREWLRAVCYQNAVALLGL